MSSVTLPPRTHDSVRSNAGRRAPTPAAKARITTSKGRWAGLAVQPDDDIPFGVH